MFGQSFCQNLKMDLEPYDEATECAEKPCKPPSRTSEIVSKFVRACKLRSIGVFANENVDQNHHQHLQRNNGYFAPAFVEETSSSDANEEVDFGGEKVHPQPVEVQEKGNECGKLEILKLFETVKALKLAYVQFQQAHIPYDRDKIKAADELVVSHLESLCKIKKAHQEKQLKDMNSVSACSALLLAEIQVQGRLLEQLQPLVSLKESEMVKLLQELQGLEVKNEKLFEVLNSPSVEEVVKQVAKSIHDFAKPLIALMKVSGWDLDGAANAIEDSAVYSKRSDKKYVFEAYIVRRLFHGFVPHTHDIHQVMKFDDPIDALIQCPQSSFAKYCRTKYLLIVHPKMEASFFGNEDHRTLVMNGVHPHTPFYRTFVKMVKWLWILQGIAASVETKADIFRVKRGSEFSNIYMESVEELKDDRFLPGEEQERFKVEFMVMPGFRIGETVIKSRVYLSTMKSSNAV